jgi:hypothetical protein
MGMPSFVVLFVKPLMLALPRLVGASPQEVLQIAHEMLNAPSPAWLNAYALVTQGLLVWFSYFSRSPRVKEHDKFWVFVAMCFAAGGWLQTALTWAGL